MPPHSPDVGFPESPMIILTGPQTMRLNCRFGARRLIQKGPSDGTWSAANPNVKLGSLPLHVVNELRRACDFFGGAMTVAYHAERGPEFLAATEDGR
jgi:hypothetical protein